MPTYEYACQHHRCRHTAEVVLPISSSTADRRCPTCKRRTFRRLVSAPAAVNDGSRVQYPHYNFQFPMQDNTPGKPNVFSPQHERDLAKQQGYLINQGMSRDYGPG